VGFVGATCTWRPFADATAEAKAHDEAFAKARGAGDVKAVVALYTDDAFVIWPGVGEEARRKAAIEKLATDLCPSGRAGEVAGGPAQTSVPHAAVIFSLPISCAGE